MGDEFAPEEDAFAAPVGGGIEITEKDAGLWDVGGVDVVAAPYWQEQMTSGDGRT